MKHKILLLILLFISSLTLHAIEIADIKIPDNVSFSDQSSKLVLNGAGIRTKFIFDIYIGSLYLKEKRITADEIYKLHGEKRVSMHFLYDEVEKEKLTNGWTEGFKNNLSDKEYEKFKLRLTQFNSLFLSVKKGDVINLDFMPTTGTFVIINDKKMGLVPGDDFFVALLKVWLGQEPADDDLKEAMLGKSENDNYDD